MESRHITPISVKAPSRAAVIRRRLYSHNITFLPQAFVTYMRPLLEYESPVSNPYSIQSINDSEQVQRFFTRRISSIRYLSYPSV